MATATCGWIDAAQRDSLLPGTEIIKEDDGFLLVAHPTIPPEADHVTVEGGRYQVILNPSALLGEVAGERLMGEG